MNREPFIHNLIDYNKRISLCSPPIRFLRTKYKLSVYYTKKELYITANIPNYPLKSFNLENRFYYVEEYKSEEELQTIFYYVISHLLITVKYE